MIEFLRQLDSYKAVEYFEFFTPLRYGYLDDLQLR